VQLVTLPCDRQSLPGECQKRVRPAWLTRLPGSQQCCSKSRANPLGHFSKFNYVQLAYYALQPSVTPGGVPDSPCMAHSDCLIYSTSAQFYHAPTARV